MVYPRLSNEVYFVNFHHDWHIIGTNYCLQVNLVDTHFHRSHSDVVAATSE